MTDTQPASGSPAVLRSPGADNLLSDHGLFPSVVRGLKELYHTKIQPAEERYKFDEFYSTQLRDSDFDAKPMVLLLGQYSTGKTSFIEYLLERQFPGQRVGPEPTTDRFVAVMHGETDRVIPGNAVSVAADKPFHALNRFGTSFLSKFEASECDAPILQHVTFIDTPGVLSGEKQRIGRSYDFINVCEWFAERADLILLLFDAHKLDISDEFKSAIEALKGHDDKIRVVLNKADMVTTQQLMRVYGALMWSLGKVVKTPEVMRVYLGSFWNKPLQNDENKKLFEAEHLDLISDLKSLPRNSAVRKVNELVKRARLVRVHSYIIGTLKKKMPSLWGKDTAKKELIMNLLETYKEIKRTYKIPAGDFPSIEKTQALLQPQDFNLFAKLDPKLLQNLEDALSKGIPELMLSISPTEDTGKRQEDMNPFAESGEEDWEIVGVERAEYEARFKALNPEMVNGKLKLSGQQAKVPLMESGLDRVILKKLWDISDIDKDGFLDEDEFVLVMHLIKVAQKDASKIPDVLPASLIPASKRSYF